MKNVILIATICTMMIGCGKPVTEREGENLLEEQQKAMEKAREIEKELQDALDERMKDL